MRRWMWSALLVVPSLLAAQNPQGRGPAGPDDSLRNLKVFPATMTRRQLIPIMQSMAGALGVECEYCHVADTTAAGRGPGGRPRLNFAADDKRTKLTARIMLRMVFDINQRLDSIPGRLTPNVPVNCTTCHRGISRPMTLGNTILGAYQAGGTDSARKAYTALHSRYYGRASYDFGELSLIGTAVEQLRASNPDAAMALLSLNGEFFPQSAVTHDAMAAVALAKGDTAAAVAHYREALQRDSTDRQALFQLRVLTGGGQPRRP